MTSNSQKTILGCPQCGAFKSRTTHSYGSYRAYLTNTTLVLRCKTCGFEQKYRYIQGGYVEQPVVQEPVLKKKYKVIKKPIEDHDVI